MDASVTGADAKRAENEMREKSASGSRSINGFAGEIRGQDLVKLERIKGLVVTEDAPTRLQVLLPVVTSTVAGGTSIELHAALDGRGRCEQALGRTQGGDDRYRRLGCRGLPGRTSPDA